MRRWLAIPVLALILLAAVTESSLGQSFHPDRVYPEFTIGPTGVRATIEKGRVIVQSIVEDSPAAGAKLQAGDVLLTVGGRSLSAVDPRVPLGEAIGEAEAGTGRLSLEFRRGAKKRKATVRLPRLGEYSDTWPEDCAKSREIVEQSAKFLSSAQDDEGAYQLGVGRPVRDNLQGCLASLFLLSTGDDRYIENVAKHARLLAARAKDRKNAGGHVNWQLGYQGILLSEYFLRTGDDTVLAGLQELCNWCVENQAAGGWSHGAPVGPGYVQSGLMNHAGLPVLITLILAQECGVTVDAAAYARAVKLIYRMAGHGCVAYGDHRSELWWSNTNGRNAMTACAFSLLDEIPRFQQASKHLALLVTDSYYQPEFGHTGGGFNVMWRGMASVHVPDERVDHYRRQMQHLAWYYDLCRLPRGGFSMPATPPDNRRYTGIEWGTGAVGLTYTAPRRTLRITGAPRTRHSRQAPPPDFDWGTESDLTFLKTDSASSIAQYEPHEIYYEILKKEKAEVSVATCAGHLTHYSPLVRAWAGRRLTERNDAEAIEALASAVTRDDPRVRRAVYDAISGYDNWSRPPRGKMSRATVSETFLPAVLKTLNNPDSAWWEIDGALFALGRAEPDDIRRARPIIERFARHEDWYLRESAFWALVGLRQDIKGDEFSLLARMYAESRSVFERSSMDAGFKAILKTDKVALDRTATELAIRVLGQTTHRPRVALGYGVGGVHEAAHRTMMILKHFDPSVYELMVDDFVAYLRRWEPYYQHSVWMIQGSKWQPGIVKVLEGLGTEGAPIVAELKAILKSYDTGDFDAKRIPGAGKDLKATILAAVAAFEAEYGVVD